MYVVDTHAWIYYLLGDLPENLKPVFRNTENFSEIIFIPSIVLNETIWLAEKGKVSINIKEMLSRFDEASNFIVAPLDLDITKKVAELKRGELHDRIIVATAQMLDSTLITKDGEIVKSRIVKTVWYSEL